MKTHWRKIHDTEHLGSVDLENLQSPIILKIERAYQKEVKNQEGKRDNTIAVHFEGMPKPMLCNVTNSQAIEKVTGTPYIEEWTGHSVELYIASVNAFGTTVDAIRIKPRKPVQKPVVTLGSKMFSDLVERIKSGATTIETARQHVVISPEVEIAVQQAVSAGAQTATTAQSEALPEGM